MSQNPQQAELQRRLQERMPNKQVRVVERDGRTVAAVRDPETGEVKTRDVNMDSQQRQDRTSSAGGARPTKGPSGSESVQEKRNEPSAGGARPTQGSTQDPDETVQPSPEGGRGQRAPDGDGLGDSSADQPENGDVRRDEPARAGSEQDPDADSGGNGGPADLARGIVGSVGSGLAKAGSTAADRGGSILSSASKRFEEDITQPAAEIGQEGGELASTGLRTSLPVGVFGTTTASAPESEEQTGDFGSGLIGGAARLANAPQFALDVREAVGVAGAGVGAVGRDLGDAATSAGADVDETQEFVDERIAPPIQQTVEAAQKNPTAFAGTLAGGAVAGSAAARGLLQASRAGRFASATRRAQNRARDRLRSDGGAEVIPDGGLRLEGDVDTGVGIDLDAVQESLRRMERQQEPSVSQQRRRLEAEAEGEQTQMVPNLVSSRRTAPSLRFDRPTIAERLDADLPGEDLRQTAALDPETPPTPRQINLSGVLEGAGVGGLATQSTGIDTVTNTGIDQTAETEPDTRVGVGADPAVVLDAPGDTITEPEIDDDKTLLTPALLRPTQSKPTPPPLVPRTTTPGRPSPRQPRILTPEDEDSSGQITLETGGGRSGGGQDDPIAPGYIGETIEDIALFGGAPPERQPTDEELEEAAGASALVGEFPTATELFGSEEEQEAIEEAGDFFSFGGGR